MMIRTILLSLWLLAALVVWYPICKEILRGLYRSRRGVASSILVLILVGGTGGLWWRGETTSFAMTELAGDTAKSGGPASALPRPDEGVPALAHLPSRPLALLTEAAVGPVPEGWTLRQFAGKARIKIGNEGGVPIVRLWSDQSSFAIDRSLEAHPRLTPILAWDWRVDRLPREGDVRVRAKDDQAAQVYVSFANRKCIGYIWDANAPAGTVIDSLLLPGLKIIVLKSGPRDLGQWLTESRNIADDYRQLFGGEPPRITRIALMINSQHTSSRAESQFRNLRLLPETLATEKQAVGTDQPV